MVFLFTIIGYLIVLLSIGVFLSKRIRKKEDFLVAGRKLTAPILVGTLLATWIGSGDIFSVADLSYHHGYSSLIGSAGGWIGIILVYFIAGRVRRFGQFTVPDILEARYNRWARLLATITTIIAYITIVSYQFRGGGWVINMVLEDKVSIKHSMILVAIFVIIYTLTAGMLSVAYQDVINGIIIISGVFLALPFLIKNGGGIETITVHVTPRAHPILGNMSWIRAMGYFVPTLLLALANANMYQRFFSAKNEKEAKRAVIGWIIGVILLGLAIQSLAVIGSSMFKNLDTKESGKIILAVAQYGIRPHGFQIVIGCILIASITAIIVSTANSFLLVPATNIMRDIVQRFLKPNISDKGMVLGTRITLIILGICAYGLIGFFPRILQAAYAAYTVYGAGLTPALLATFFWKRATAKGGVASILGGMTVTIGWEIAKRLTSPMDIPSFQYLQGVIPGLIRGDSILVVITTAFKNIPAVYPALICSVGLLLVISLSDKKPSKEKWIPFFTKDK
jgi:SSS family solute:Na+ symporter/sodium/proline symporter